MNKRYDLDKFTLAYIEALLWSSTDDDGDPLDSNYDVRAISDEAIDTIAADCEKFQKENWDLMVSVGNDLEQHGHDFFLTRNHHGVGFWERGYGDTGDQLTEKAHAYGESDPYVGDDGKIYV